jgi:hypothetical protein
MQVVSRPPRLGVSISPGQMTRCETGPSGIWLSMPAVSEDEALLQGHSHRFGAAGYLQLGEDIADVEFDG